MRSFVKDNFSIIALVVLGSLSWSLTMVKSGLIYPFGMGFWGPNGHDGIWHIALINHLSRGSFEMPIFAGDQIKNYHIGFDLILAGIHKLTYIPAHTIYFQIIPPILSVLIGFLTYKLVILWKNSKIQALWATFFVYFAGDFGWLLTLLRGDGLGGESLFWAQQAVSTLINPPFAISLALILGGIICLLKLIQKFSIQYLIFSILLFGLLAGIKVYASVLVLGALGAVFLFHLTKHPMITPLRNSVTLRYGLLILGVTFLSVIFFLPLNSGSQKLVVFQPFWFLETMMAISDRVGWQRFYEAMMNYKTGNIWVKLIPAYIVAFAIFFVGNMGTRLIGLWGMWKSKLWKEISEVDVFLLTIAGLGTILPMLILQAGTPWNTIQFFYYTLFVFAIYTGIWVGQLIEVWNRHVYSILVYYTRVVLIVVLTIPTTLSTLSLHYLPGRPPAKISNEELEALRFLEKQPNGVVLTYPFDRYKADQAINNPPRPLYLYESTAYVAAFSEKVVFLEDEVNLDITGYEWRHRRDEAKIPLTSPDQDEVREFLAKNKIKYLYLVLSQTPVFGQRFRLGESQLGLTNIFENSEVVIYRVN